MLTMYMYVLLEKVDFSTVFSTHGNVLCRAVDKEPLILALTAMKYVCAKYGDRRVFFNLKSS